MAEEPPIDELLKKVKDLPFKDILAIAKEVREKSGAKVHTPEGWQIFSFVTQMGLMLKLDIRLRRLSTTIKNLDKRNRALQIAVLALGFVTAFSASYQFLRDWLDPHPLGNFFMSFGFTLLLAAIVSVWLKSAKS